MTIFDNIKVMRPIVDNRIIVIGDIHGCIYTLKNLIDTCAIDFNKDKVVFLGDYIDRGKHPLDVVKLLKELTEKYPNDVIALMGNHEKMCVNAFKNAACRSLWNRNGGDVTEQELSLLNKDEVASIIDWMKNLPMMYNISEWGFCHSGWWGEDLDDYGEPKVLWNRDWLYDDKLSPTGNQTDKFIFFGHTPV